MENVTPLVRKRWVDSVRGIAMLCIVLNHTDIYLAGEPVVSFELFGTNALMTFFVVSGYLFYKGEGCFDARRKLTSEFRHLVVPYFLFTIPIAVMKSFVYGTSPFSVEMLMQIVCGQASWFVAARVVAGILFASLIALSQSRRFAKIAGFQSVILPVGCVLLCAVPFVADCGTLHIWNADIALMSLVYLCAGYYFHKFERVVERLNIWLCVPALLAVVGIKFIESKYDLRVPVSPSQITSFPVFFADTILSAFAVIMFFRRFSRCRMLNYVGRNSIVFYFLCGGVPLLAGMAFRRIGLPYSGDYLVVLLDFAVVVSIMSLLTFVIVKYFPFMIGKTKSDIRRMGH